MSTERKTSEVLDLAADVIEQRGWCTGSWNNTRDDRPVCIEGGIAAALGVEIDLGGNYDDSTYNKFTSCPAYVAVREYLGMDKEDVLYVWNDMYRGGPTGPEPARSKEQVIEVLRSAAAVERAKEESLENTEIKK